MLAVWRLRTRRGVVASEASGLHHVAAMRGSHSGQARGSKHNGEHRRGTRHEQKTETRAQDRQVGGALDQDELTPGFGDLGEELWTGAYGKTHGPYPPGPKGYKRSDERIREDVCDVLMQMSDLDSSDVEVAVREGEVVLTGTVPDRSMKYRIEQVADRCAGIVDITNQIRVKRS
jgi:hypothetical protein